jgi:hypothetical protein
MSPNHQKEEGMDLRTLLKRYMEDNGYDGLFNPNSDCACEKDDLAPCDEMSIECTLGVKGACDPETCPIDGECEWHIVLKPAPPDPMRGE